MESVREIMGKTKRTRANMERITMLETENAILHLKTAQLQHTIKKLLLLKSLSVETESCRKCDPCKEKAVLLHTQIQLLRKQLVELQAHYSSLEQQIGDKLQTLRSIFPAVAKARQQTNQQELSDLQAKYFRERWRRKALHNTLVELRGNIRVHCRVRPVLSFDRGAMECVRCTDDETVRVKHSQSSLSGTVLLERAFEFDRVHPPGDSQAVVFSEVQPLIVSLLDGYNVCIMAYGQTGSGKTHTMLGGFSKHSAEGNYGVIHLAAHELFRLIEEREMVHVCVTVTVVEIYNERIKDLLLEGSEDNVRHEVVASSNGSMDVTNLTVRPVLTSEELISLVHLGMRQRAVGRTLIHDHSSRSHLIVTVRVCQAPSSGRVSAASSTSSLNNTITPVQSRESTPVVSPNGSPPLTLLHTHSISQNSCSRNSSRQCASPSPEAHVKLQFVDLAGSECVGTSGASGSSLKEAQHINKSLSSLSDVLGALVEKRNHIPYRNSTLTHLLQDTIGGDAKMVMLLCISPTVQYVGESLRVLGFGKRARQVQRGGKDRRRLTL